MSRKRKPFALPRNPLPLPNFPLLPSPSPLPLTRADYPFPLDCRPDAVGQRPFPSYSHNETHTRQTNTGGIFRQRYPLPIYGPDGPDNRGEPRL
jgi:hypothetical protein